MADADSTDPLRQSEIWFRETAEVKETPNAPERGWPRHGTAPPALPAVRNGA